MELKKILKTIVDSTNLILVESKTSGNYAKLVVDTEEGITLKRIAELTNLINNDRRIDDLHPQGIRFEVTSPGTDYPMTHLFQFKRNLGRTVRIEHGLEEIPNPAEGKIILAKKDNIKIQNRGGRLSFHLSEIVHCRLVIH